MSESSITAVPESGSDQAQVWQMYRAVVGVGIACALVIVIVYEVTRPIIQRNRIELRKQAVLDVLPGAEGSAAFQLTDSGSFASVSVDSDAENVVFAGYDEDNVLVGLAIEAQGMGYQDVIRLVYGYSFESQAIIGISVLESRETPGLGDRIETDEQFLRNFESLDVRLADGGGQLAHPIEFVKPDEKTAAWQIDGISGATISSRAVAQMLNESATWWIPRVWKHQADFLRDRNGQQHGN